MENFSLQLSPEIKIEVSDSDDTEKKPQLTCEKDLLLKSANYNFDESDDELITLLPPRLEG